MAGKGDKIEVNKKLHRRLAEDAQRRAEQTSNKERKKSLENLARQHRNIAEKGKPD